MPESDRSPRPTDLPEPVAPSATPDTHPHPGGPDGTVVQSAPPTVAYRPRGPVPTVPGFDLVEELGRGSMGVVYKARQHGLNRLVALKMVLHGAHATASDLDRFRAEAGAVARLRHPHIVEVYAFGETADGLPYYALEFCPGGTLADRGPDPLPVPTAADLVAKMARAVQAAHDAGIVHRDLKPANVLLTADGTPKITDFGLAKGLDEADARTRTGAVMGTPSYMAPEQAAGRTKEVGPAADVYALGAVLYFLLTGRPPFAGAGGVLETLQFVQTAEPARPRAFRKDVPPDLEAVVLRCLEKRPFDRYPTAAALADDLERWLRGEPVTARRGRAYRVRKWAARNRVRLATLGAVLGGLLAGWVLLADAGAAVPGGDRARRLIDRYELSAQRPAPTVAEIKASAAGQRAELTDHALHRAPRFGRWLSGKMKTDGDLETGDSWTQVHAFSCLFAAPETTEADLRPLIALLHTDMFGPNDLFRPFDPRYGWPHFVDSQPGTEGCGWALAAVPLAASRPGLCPPAERERLLARLGQVQALFDRCHVRRAGRETGRWAMVAESPDPLVPNIYTTALVFQGLIEMTRADLPWGGTTARRDELYRLTRAALLEQFDGRGWATRVRSESDLNDGLTLHLFALFLRAERCGLDPVPDPMAEQIGRHLRDCGGRKIEHPIVTAVFDSRAYGFDGQPVYIQRPVRCLWHPWATECAARWLARLQRTGAPREEQVAVRRVLGHLVLKLGTEAVPELKDGYTFVLMETLMGLTAVEDLD